MAVEKEALNIKHEYILCHRVSKRKHEIINLSILTLASLKVENATSTASDLTIYQNRAYTANFDCTTARMVHLTSLPVLFKTDMVPVGVTQKDRLTH